MFSADTVPARENGKTTEMYAVNPFFQYITPEPAVSRNPISATTNQPFQSAWQPVTDQGLQVEVSKQTPKIEEQEYYYDYEDYYEEDGIYNYDDTNKAYGDHNNFLTGM